MQATTPRYDIYALIHKGLRACLSHNLVSVGQLDWTDSDEVAAVMDEVADLMDFCRLHVEKEGTYVHSAMEKRRPGSSDGAEEEHKHHLREIDALAAQAFTIRMLPVLRREEAVHALYQQLARFVANNLEHMAMEEREHNRILWDTHSDEEIMAIERAIVASQSPQDGQRSLRWMLTAMRPTERAGFLTALRQNAPGEVFDDIMRKLRSLLPERDMLKLYAALGLGRRPLDYVGTV